MRRIAALAMMAMMAVGAAVVSLPAAAQEAAEVPASTDACFEQAQGDPTALQECSSQRIDASMALLPRARANKDLEALFPDMFDPLMNRLTGGGDALVARVSVMAAYADLAGEREAILNGDAMFSERRPVRRGPFSGLRNSRALARRWAAIRTSDCADYPVVRCAERLDAAMRDMIDSLAPGDDD